jgi:hypothetical protein
VEHTIHILSKWNWNVNEDAASVAGCSSIVEVEHTIHILSDWNWNVNEDAASVAGCSNIVEVEHTWNLHYANNYTQTSSLQFAKTLNC